MALTSPVAQWLETPDSGAALPIARMVWSYDAGTGAWTMTDDSTLRDGELVDLAGTGAFTLELLGVADTTDARLVAARVNGGSIILY